MSTALSLLGSAARAPTMKRGAVLLAHQFAGFARAHPRASAVCSSFTLGFLGDAACQIICERAERHDQSRSARIGSFSAFYCGAFYSALLPRYAKWFPAARFGGSVGAGLAKSCVDNFVTSPLLYFPLLYTWLGLTEGRSVEQTLELASASYLNHNLAHCAIWLPALAVGFARVPVHLQVLYINMVSVYWTCTMSYISHYPPALPALEPPPQESPCSTDPLEQPEQERPLALPALARGRIGLDPDQQFEHWLGRFSQEDRASMDRYREGYQQFRRGEAHGACDGQLWDAEERASQEMDFRQKYQQFRLGSAHGASGQLCRGV